LNIGSIPSCKNLTPSWNKQGSQTKSTSVMLQNSFFSLSNLSCNVDKGNSGILVAAAAAWQCQWQWWRWWRCGGSGGGSSLMVTRWQTQQCGSGSGGGNVAAAAWQHWGSSGSTVVVLLKKEL
jgi:hypothetical protein